MRDEDCVRFLQDVLPRMGLRWAGFRRVRGQVCKRIDRRMRTLGLAGADAYRAYLDAHPGAWDELDAMCRVTISRFYRDRTVFDCLREDVLPAQAGAAEEAGESAVGCWCAGCASGEEVYTLRIVWRHALQRAYPAVDLRVTATDSDAHLLGRARRGCYQRGTLRGLPEAWRTAAFRHDAARTRAPYCVRGPYREGIVWRRQDVRADMPAGPFRLVLCRNLVFTYFDEPLQLRCLRRLASRLAPGGALVLGRHEVLPAASEGFEAWDGALPIYRRQ